MDGWLSLLVHELSEGREPVLTLAEIRNLARVAVLDERGQFLASDLGNDALERAVSNQALNLKGGQASTVIVNGVTAVSEKVTRETFPFWKEALKGRDDSWASWLLTISSPEQAQGKITRHILSALGPFTQPRLPDSAKISLVPLNPGLGRLFVFGDDDLALETAAIAARAGLKVTLVSANSLEMDLRSAQQVGPFELRPLSDWSEMNAEALEEMGFKSGVAVLVTCAQKALFMNLLNQYQIGWLGLAGEAADLQDEPGLFPLATTAALKALGLVAAILDRS
ncbi:MAG: hypothetical protein LBE80_01435 [Deltaproteobacteria bacterium]|nr:hypothetical protein [Deltaproteobacteria bacterium]